MSLLFADIRGSTTIGERLSPTDFRAFLDRFYRIASGAVLASDGMVDKFVGDEVIGLFFGGISGERHAAAAVAAGRSLLSHAGRDDATPTGPIPVGAAVHTGVAFVGSTATEDIVSDFTALGDVVNTTARLAGAAASGELLISVEAASAAGTDILRARASRRRGPWSDRARGGRRHLDRRGDGHDLIRPSPARPPCAATARAQGLPWRMPASLTGPAGPWSRRPIGAAAG